MKFLVLVFLCASSVTVWSQGQLIFDNQVNNLVVAPVYGFDSTAPQVAEHGNTPAGTPTGTQSYPGVLLSGSEFTAQLFGGSSRAVVPNLQPLFPTVSFRTNERAGFVQAPNLTVRVPGVAAGEPARIVLRAWENRAGSITNWEQVLADPTIARGESRSFITPPLGGLLVAPPNLVGLESFNLATGGVSAARWKINFQPDAVDIPPGYLADYGLTFGVRPGGFMFGWNVARTSATRARHAANSPDARHDTFIHMSPAPEVHWEIAVPNGVYAVHTAAGDPGTIAGAYRLQAENVTVLEGTPVAGQNWVESDALVEVRDGRLTLNSGPGAISNRLCFVDIALVEKPTLRTSSADRSPFAVQFDAASGVRYQIQSSSNLVQFDHETIGVAAPDGTLRFVETNRSGGQVRVFRTQTLTTSPSLLVYTNAFATDAGSEWSPGSIAVAPLGQTILGPFGGGPVRLTLTNLPVHTRLTLTCELFILGSWEGNSPIEGPDRWEVRLANGPSFLKTTFRTIVGEAQAFPGLSPGGSFPPETGAADKNVLGYGVDLLYRLSYTVLHQDGSAVIEFVAGTTEGPSNESWALDNLAITVRNDPYD